ncbi:hypothetical protein Hypma_016180 [Hypsizygus marmoreus]|uniref:F-box domain-containing protein n=1 Tax=Hypsizygus marmoreus TaxID=39966 RepID=A0A369J0Q0_HYPMA|nr:hypothetical protein Hypma_016180 [Hypsizygus marmoreus]
MADAENSVQPADNDDMASELHALQIVQSMRRASYESSHPSSISQSQLSSVVDYLDCVPALPSDTQAGILQTVITSNEKEVIQLRARIHELEAETKHYRSFFSPIRVLPNELLLKIFRLLVPKKLRAPHTLSAPLVLCHVCASWRTLVLGAPVFWTKLEFPMQLKFFEDDFSKHRLHAEKETCRHKALLDFWFSNAASCPLTFVLYTTARTDPSMGYPYYSRDWDFSPIWDSSLSAIAKHSHRFQRLVLELNNISVFRRFLLRSDLAFPLLKELVIRIKALTGDEWDMWTSDRPYNLQAWPVFKDATSLRSTTVELPGGMHFQLQLPFARLIEMDWSETMLPTADFRSKLQVCTSLRKGSFLIGEPEYIYEPLSDDIHASHCSNVIDLTVEFRASSWLQSPQVDPRSLDGLTLPALKRFVLASVRKISCFPWVGESHNLSSQISLHLLHSLTLSRIHISTDDFLAVLELSSNLTDLSFGLSIDQDRFFEFLTHLMPCRPPRLQLANLQRLAFIVASLSEDEESSGEPFSLSIFQSMVESRSTSHDACKPLQSVHLFVRRPWEAWNRSSLTPLLAQLALDVRVSKIRFRTTAVHASFELRDHSSVYEFHKRR